MTDEPTRVLTAMCPLSWCDHTVVVENPDTDYDAALKLRTHVNQDHSDADRRTLLERTEVAPNEVVGDD